MSICHQQTYLKRIATGNSLNRKETKEGKLNHQEGGKNRKSKNSGRYSNFPLLEFSKLCLVEEKNVTQSDVVPHMKRKHLR